MRAGMKPEWLKIDGKLIGVNLGADYCAEHEWGIGALKGLFGIDGATPRSSREKPKFTKPAGLPRRMISKHDCVRFYQHGKKAVLLGMSAWRLEQFDEAIAKHGKAKALKDNLPQDLTPWQGVEFRTAWSDDDFGIYGEGEHVEHMAELAKAFLTNNIALWIGGVQFPPFENGGLVIAIADRAPAEGMKLLEEGDLDQERLAAASAKTGIIERLKKAGKGYFACSPKWFDGFKPMGEVKKTAHPVIYWLNPMEQDENNFGWFTVEDLDQWIQGTGPIPKKVMV